MEENRKPEFHDESAAPADTVSSDIDASLASVAKGATVIFAGIVAGNLLGMVNQVILGRFLGPERYGLYNLSMSVAMIAGTLCVFGLFGSLSRLVPFHLKKKERDVVRSMIDFGSLFTALLGIVLAAAVFLLSDRLAESVFHEARLATALKVFAFAIPLHGLHQVAQGTVRGFKAAKYEALVFSTGSRVVTISVFLLSLSFVERLHGAILAYVVGVATTTAVGFWLVRTKMFPDYGRQRRVPVARSLLSFSWPLALTGFTFLFVTKTDKVMIGYFLDSKDVGIYSPAVMVAMLLDFVNNAFKYRFLPTASEFFAKDDLRGLRPLYKSTSKWSFLVVYPMFLVILAFPKEILTILYGSRYAGGYVALVVVSLGIAVNDFSGTSGNILVAGGRTRANLACEVVGAVSNVLLNLLLIPRFGIVGAAAATASSYLARNVSSLTLVYRSYSMLPYTKRYTSIVLSGVAAFVPVYVLKSHSPLPWWATTVAGGAVLLVLYAAATLVTRSFDRNDLVIVEAIERKTGWKLDAIKRFVG